MIYNFQTTHAHLAPCKAFDADGMEIIESVVWFDSDSGEACILLRDENGHHYPEGLQQDRAATAMKKYKAPIVLEPREDRPGMVIVNGQWIHASTMR